MTLKLISGLSAGALLAVSLSGSGRAGTAADLPDYRQAAYVLADGRERGQKGTAIWADETAIALATYDRVEVFGGTTYNQVTGIRLPSAHATTGLGGIGGDSRYLYAAETYDDAVDVIRRSDWSIVTSVYINQPYKIAVNTSYFACAGSPARIWRKADFSLLTNLGIQAGDLYANDSCFLAGDLTSKTWKVYDAASFALVTAISRPPAAIQVYGGGLVGDDYLLATYSGDTSLYVHSQADFSLHTVIPGPNSALYDSVSSGSVCAVSYGHLTGGDGLRFYLTDGDWSLLTAMTGIMSDSFDAMGVHDGTFYLPATSAFYAYGDSNGAPAKGVGGVFLLETGKATLFWHCNGNAHRVEWGTDGAAYSEESDFADSGWNHTFVLPLPESGDACYYRAWTEGQLMCEDAIASAKAGFAAFTLGLLADQQSGQTAWSASTQLYGRYRPDFSVSLGDQVENAYWSSFMEWYGWEYPWLRQTPKIAVLGNHDDEPPWNGFYPVPYDGCYYSFEIGNVHFSVVDTGCELSIKKGTAQWNWLSGDLWSASQPWKIILSHVGPYTAAVNATGIQDATCASDVVPLAKAAGVKAWVYGHNHMAQHIVVDGIDYIHVPAACGCYSYTQQTDWPDVRFYSQTEGFGLLSCQSDTLSFSYYDFSGERTYGPISIESPTPPGYRTPTPPPSPSPLPTAAFPPSPTAPATPVRTPTPPGYRSPTPGPTRPPSPTPTCGPPLPPERAVTASGDYDGDGTAEVAVFRPATGLWSVREVTRLTLGASADQPAAGDYDGDGTAEAAVFRPATGLWSVAGVSRAYFGGAEDRAAPADFDGDGACDLAIFRGDGGLWSVRFLTRFYFGSPGDWPLPGDYEGDGTAGAGLFRPDSGQWMIRSLTRFYFGSSADRPVPGDYGGEGRRIAAVYRPCSGMWSIRGFTRIYFGNCFDHPLPADLDGDGTDDAVVFRGAAGMWSARNLTRLYFGSTGDVAVTR